MTGLVERLWSRSVPSQRRPLKLVKRGWFLDTNAPRTRPSHGFNIWMSSNPRLGEINPEEIIDRSVVHKLDDSDFIDRLWSPRAKSGLDRAPRKQWS